MDSRNKRMTFLPENSLPAVSFFTSQDMWTCLGLTFSVFELLVASEANEGFDLPSVFCYTCFITVRLVGRGGPRGVASA
eukprot:3832369-Amphidinium_carterae.2